MAGQDTNHVNPQEKFHENHPNGHASAPPLIMKLATPVSLTSILWVKQLAIRLGCKRPQPSRWLSRKRATLTQTLSQRERDRSLFPPRGESWIEGWRRTNRYASFTLNWSLVIVLSLAAAAEAQQTINGCLIKRKTNCPGVNLSGANLTKSNLSGADLAGANLSGSDLSGSKITETNLTKANLSNANFSSANLSETYLTGANLSHANLAKADLSQSTLPDANLRESSLAGANLALAILKGSDLTGAKAKGTAFVMTSLVNANLTRVDLTEATLVGADIRNAILEGAIFCKTTMPDRSINNSGCPK